MNRLITRRNLLGGMSAGLASAAGLVLAVPILGYLLYPLFKPAPQEWRDLGPVDNYKVGETVEVSFQEPSPLPWAGQTAKTAAWVRRTGQNDFIAFAVNCTHLGCPVNWQPGAELFLCPCHGGVYYANGEVAAGPPPRRLFHYDLRIRDGHLELLTRPLQLV